MNHRQLEVFRAVIWANGITAGAKALNVSQPAVSRMISDLEYSVGFKLFYRLGNRAYPTDEARLFLEEVERSFVGLEALQNAAQEIRTLSRGNVRISSSVSSSLSTLPAATHKFAALHPSVRIKVTFDHSPRVAELTSSRLADIGLIARVAEYTGVEIFSQYKFHYVCVIPINHELAELDCICPENMAASKFILPDRGYLKDNKSGVDILRLINPELIIDNDHAYSACAYAAEGVGIAIVDPLNASYFSSFSKVVTRPLSLPIPFVVSLIKAKGKKLSKASQAFAEVIDQEIVSVYESLGPDILEYQPPSR